MSDRPVMFHFGRSVPKDLRKEGWQEVGQAVHLGRGVWLIRLEKFHLAKPGLMTEEPRCERCGGTVLAPAQSGVPRGTCHCPANLGANR